MYALTEYLRPRSDRISKVTMGTPATDKISAYKNLKSSTAHGTKNQHSEPTYIAERTPIANALNPHIAASWQLFTYIMRVLFVLDILLWCLWDYTHQIKQGGVLPHDGTPCRQVFVMSNNTLCPGDGNVVPGDKPVRKTAIGDSFYMWQTCCSFDHQSTYHVFLSTRTNSSNSPLDDISGSMVKMPTHVVLHESLSKTVSEIGSFNNSKGYLDSEQSRTCLSYHICFDQPPESGKRTFFPKITK